MENNKEQPKVYTYHDVAQILNICKRGASLLMKRKDFPSFKLGSRTLVNIQDFNDWLDNLAGKEVKISSRNRGKNNE